jgi:BirA family transcriptional regulator, biotin operon repressor / biotin---[acetyl-CoA-carboxylase] ligase
LSLTNHKDFPFIILHSVDSTNNYAMGLVHAGMAQHGTAVYAREQTNGRGQRNRQWISEENSNIILTVILEINTRLSSSQMFLLSKAVAVATARFFNTYCAGGTTIKWPNDIYWNDRKAGGILIENVFHGKEWKHAVVGMGININQTKFGGLYSRAVSLKQITGKDHEPEQLAQELRKIVLEFYNELLREPSGIINQYKELLFKRDETIRLKKGMQVFEGVVRDVTDFGELVIAHPLEEKFAVGEVEWII